MEPLTHWSQSDIEPDPDGDGDRDRDDDASLQIKKALSELSPHTRHSLLTLLLTTPQLPPPPPPPPSQPPSPSLDMNDSHPGRGRTGMTDADSSHQSGLGDSYAFLHQQLPLRYEPLMPCTPPPPAFPFPPPGQTQLDQQALTTGYSGGCYRGPLSQQSPFQDLLQPPLDFFSPLTSPALRPLGYQPNPNPNPNPNNSPLAQTIPALIHQAATLGLSTSTPRPFLPNDLLASSSSKSSSSSSHPDPRPDPRPDLHIPNLPSSFLPNAALPLFPDPNQFLHSVSTHSSLQRPIHDSPIHLPPESIHSSPRPRPPNPNSHPQLHPGHQTHHHSGRPRPVRSSKNRPSPLVRPADDPSKTGDERSLSAKRVRSTPGLSATTTPDFPGALAQNPLADAPSPIDTSSKDFGLWSSSSSSIRDNLSTHAIPPQTPPTYSLPQALPTLPFHPQTWHMQPMTPASLLNFEKPLAMTSAIHDANEPRPHTGELLCAKLDSVVETDEPIDAFVLDKPSSTLGPPNLIQDTHTIHLQVSNDGKVDQQQICKSQESDGIRLRDKQPSSNGPKTKRGKPKGEGRCEKKNKERKQRQCGTNLEEEGPEDRKSSHKVAEQRRRDSLKMCFEDLRQLLPAMNWNEKEEQLKRPGEGNVGGQRSVNAFDPCNPNKGMSKVALLRRSNEYIACLKERLRSRDGAIEKMVQILEETLLLDPSGDKAHQTESQLQGRSSSRSGTRGALEQSADAKGRNLSELKTLLTRIKLENQGQGHHNNPSVPTVGPPQLHRPHLVKAASSSTSTSSSSSSRSSSSSSCEDSD